MKSVVITGGSRGLGYEMAKCFLDEGYNVTICGRDPDRVSQAVENLAYRKDKVMGVLCDVRNRQNVEELWQRSIERWGIVDVWINNAGITQAGETLWDLSPEDVHNVVGTNLLGAIFGMQIAMQGMLRQGHGQIFSVEGFGSNDMQRKGLNLYGTTKRALTHFATAFAKEAADTPVKIGLLSPGMMVTDFLKGPSGEIRHHENTKRIFNILGDKPDTVARFLVLNIMQNKGNGARIVWLTKKMIFWRFMKSVFVKRNLFED